MTRELSIQTIVLLVFMVIAIIVVVFFVIVARNSGTKSIDLLSQIAKMLAGGR